MSTIAIETSAEPHVPSQPLLHLDALWIQVAGTLCNLTCSHCFVSSGPGNRRHDLMSREAVRDRVAEALPLGVREFYLTGGEPFLNPDLMSIVADTLEHGPTTVLTNGTLLGEPRVEELRALSDASRCSLEIRISLDGVDAETHDACRGAGTFARALEGILRCDRAGLLPLVTVTRALGDDPLEVTERYAAMLRRQGIERPRIKVLPIFQLGRQAALAGPYGPEETLAGLGEAFDPTRLQCGSCRAVSSRGVFVCPLLVDEPGGRLGARLDEALGPVPLRHGACLTCWVTGMTCGN